MATFVVDTGLALTTGRIKSASSEPLNIGWGDGAGTTARTDTTLFVERGTDAASATAGLARTVGTSTQQTTNTANDTYQVTGTRTATVAISVTNAGLFDVAAASATSQLFLKGDFGTIALAISDSIAFTIKSVFDN